MENLLDDLVSLARRFEILNKLLRLASGTNFRGAPHFPIK